MKKNYLFIIFTLLLMYTPIFATGILTIDNFESGTAGNNLPSPWSLTGTPAVHAYNHTYPRTGSSMEAKITSDGSNNEIGIYQSVPTSATEIRFWLYLDSYSILRRVQGAGATFFVIRWGPCQTGIWPGCFGDGNVIDYNHSGTWTTIGTFTIGVWVQYQILINYPNHTFTLSNRTSVSDPWTVLDTNLNMINSTDVPPINLEFVGYQSASLWIDNLEWRDRGHLFGD